MIKKEIITFISLLLFATGTASAQDINGFKNDIRDIDPDGDVVVNVEQNGDLAYITVSNLWYDIACYQRQQVAKGFRRLWRQNGGQNVSVFDRAGTEVADWQFMSNDFDIRGCDNLGA